MNTNINKCTFYIQFTWQFNDSKWKCFYEKYININKCVFYVQFKCQFNYIKWKLTYQYQYFKNGYLYTIKYQFNNRKIQCFIMLTIFILILINIFYMLFKCQW